MPKATNAEMEMRTSKVYDLLVSGYARHQILEYVNDKTDWDICTRSIDELIARASRLIASEQEFFRTKELARQYAGLNSVIMRARDTGDLKAELQARRQMIDLLGLRAPDTARSELWDKAERYELSNSDIFNAMLEAEHARQIGEN